MAEDGIKFHGNVCCDSLEPGESTIVINNIHCFLLEELNKKLDLSISVLKCLTGYEYKALNLQDPYLANIIML